ncbi:MAG: hypothetical protein AAB944_02105 [Patescibacteria group bacterium]
MSNPSSAHNPEGEKECHFLREKHPRNREEKLFNSQKNLVKKAMEQHLGVTSPDLSSVLEDESVASRPDVFVQEKEQMSKRGRTVERMVIVVLDSRDENKGSSLLLHSGTVEYTNKARTYIVPENSVNILCVKGVRFKVVRKI